ncbi:hypothetical protein BBJ28_00005067 [Nothophytophthora sp. Chile5]|nr:hypothetical protein BBJ28_00005067 [Nothophytophthora sp. Chile5]
MKLVTPLVAAVAGAAGAWAFARHLRRQRLEQEAYVALMRGLAEPHKYRDAPVVIVVDVGSSSIRASCFALVAGAEWVVVNGSLQQQHLDSIDVHGEADSAHIAATVERILDQALAFLRATQLTDRIVGVGFSTLAMNVLGVDSKVRRKGAVDSGAHSLQCNLSAVCCGIDIDRLRVCINLIGDVLGTVIHPAYAPATFLRLHEEEPATVERVAKWQSLSGFLIGKWTTAMQQRSDKCLPISFSEASWMGLLDFRRSQWDSRLLELIRMDNAKMPPVADSSVPFSGLNPTFLKRWPELASVPFFLGVADGAAANIGSKCIDAS